MCTSREGFFLFVWLIVFSLQGSSLKYIQSNNQLLSSFMVDKDPLGFFQFTGETCSIFRLETQKRFLL